MIPVLAWFNFKFRTPPRAPAHEDYACDLLNIAFHMTSSTPAMQHLRLNQILKLVAYKSNMSKISQI